MAYLISIKSLLDEVCNLTPSTIPKRTQKGAPVPRMYEHVPESRAALLHKKEKLVHILDKVEARYWKYRDLVTRFNAQAGLVSKTPYTIFSQKRMSSHFRCIKDAVKSQLRVVTRALTEVDVRTSKVQYLEHEIQQIRQQRALHADQLASRLPQNTNWRWNHLPEHAVPILRAHLFQNFLYPYPSRAEKDFLAQQTGLKWSQVSTWFFNARVRLWRPMVEELYMEEQRESAARAAEMHLKMSQNMSTETEKGKEHDTGPSETIPKVQVVWNWDLNASCPQDGVEEQQGPEANAGGFLIPKTQWRW